eukprot:COSAG05_NODE_2004_length_3719_cov_28.261393_3_plen_79_part_00
MDEEALRAAFDAVDLDESGIIDGGEVTAKPPLCRRPLRSETADTLALHAMRSTACSNLVSVAAVSRAVPEIGPRDERG